MTVVEQIKKDRIKAIKNRDHEESSLLGLIVADIQLIEKDTTCEDVDVFKIITKLKKGIQENLDTINRLTASPEVLKFLNEIEILNKYLPKQMDYYH